MGTNSIGLVLIIAGWYQASGEVTVRGQLTWLNVSMVGLGVSGWANGMWLWRGRQVIGLARATMLPLASNRKGPRPTPALPESSLVTGPGMSRFHRPSCPLVAGKDVSGETLAHFERRGLTACDVCQP